MEINLEIPSGLACLSGVINTNTDGRRERLTFPEGLLVTLDFPIIAAGVPSRTAPLKLLTCTAVPLSVVKAKKIKNNKDKNKYPACLK